MTSPIESLNKLAEPGGALHHEKADAAEYQGLVQSGTACLTDSLNRSNALESRFVLAYRASHAFSLAALRRLGFRPDNRYIVFQAIPHTLGLGADVWRVLDRCHQLRNRSEYDGILDIDEKLMADLVRACRSVQNTLVLLPAPN
jgi:hypothetical protein